MDPVCADQFSGTLLADAELEEAFFIPPTTVLAVAAEILMISELRLRMFCFLVYFGFHLATVTQTLKFRMRPDAPRLTTITTKSVDQQLVDCNLPSKEALPAPLSPLQHYDELH